MSQEDNTAVEQAVHPAQPSQDDKILQAQERAKKERDRLIAELEAEKKARANLEAEMIKAEEARKVAELEKLQPNEKIQAQMSMFQEQLRKERESIAAEKAAMSGKLRAWELAAYRERAIRAHPDLPQRLVSMVAGGSEEEIDRSIDEMVEVFQEMKQILAPKMSSQEYMPAPPPNPAYVSQTQSYGYPTPVNPVPVTDASPELGVNVKDITSEEAVRSGRYSGEMRDAVHKILRQQHSGNVSVPQNRQPSPPPVVGYVQQPGGVMQPQGTKMGPSVPAKYQGQYAPQAALTPQQAARAEALEAIARTHQGTNPALADPGAAQALADTRQYAAAKGIMSSAEAYAKRFVNTPPIRQG